MAVSRLRIVYITDQLPYGPGETFILPEIEELRARGHEVLVLPLRVRGPVVHADAQPLLPHTRRLSPRNPLFWLGALWTALTHPRVTARLIARYRHASAAAQWAGNVKSILKGLAAAPLVQCWRAHHIHAHWADYTATMAQALAETTGLTWSYTCHRYDAVANNCLALKYDAAAFSRFISQSTMHLAASAADEPSLRMGHPPIPMGVRVPPDEPHYAVSAPARLLCPANFVPIKGHHVLLAAFAYLRTRGVDAHLWLAGDGELRPAIEQQIDELQLHEAVTILGHVPQETLLAWYRDRTVAGVVLPSLDLGAGQHEGIPVSLMEAMAHGIPVISTPTGGIPELVTDGAGVLVEPGNATALAEAMATVLSDRPLQQRLGQAGRAVVQERFAVTKTTEKLLTQIEVAVTPAWALYPPPEEFPTGQW